MTLSNPKQYYSRFLKGHEDRLHFAAHSHHFWPDVTREAQLQYWDDCALMSDEKWKKIFDQVIPVAQQHLARILNLKHPQQIAFAPNTHELSTRLLSLFLGRTGLKILTTSSEFYSWRRQFLRLSELPGVTISSVDTTPLLHDKKSFMDKLMAEIRSGHDLIFLSQVFFDSGLALSSEDLQSLVGEAPEKTLFVVDGYHAMGAIPTDLSSLEGRIFYLGGGYKYAQAGEGVGFMVIPKGHWRPAYTGWFAEFSDLSHTTDQKVGYSTCGMSFMGATQDPSGLYRLNAVWDLFTEQKITVPKIHQHVIKLQKLFLQLLPKHVFNQRGLIPLFHPSLEFHGHFLSFEAPSEEDAQIFQKALEREKIIIDRRGKRPRFGFGLYQDEFDVKELCLRLEKLA